MSKSTRAIALAMMVAGILSGAEYRMMFSRYHSISPKEYPECVSGFAESDDIEGHPCLVVKPVHTSPVTIRTPEFLKASAEGSIRFYYRPNLPLPSKGQSLLLHTLLHSVDQDGNSVLIGINNYGASCQIPLFLIGNPDRRLENYGPYREYVLKTGRWHMFEIMWTRERMMLLIDGNLADSTPMKGAVRWGDTLSIGGRGSGYPHSAPGWISHITFSDHPIRFSGRMPLTMKQLTPGTHRELQRIKDTEKGFYFFFETPKSPAEITVCPSIFRFKKGDCLWVENTGGVSYETVAEKDNELTMTSGPSLFSQVMISHTIPNLARNLVFALSELKTDLKSFSDGLPNGLVEDAWWQEAGSPLGTCRKEVSLQTPASGNVVVARSDSVAVEAGKRYLASVDYFSSQLREGNQVYFGVQIKDENGKEYTYNDYVKRRNDIRRGVNLTICFNVPAEYKNPSCRIKVAASGKPFKAVFRNFDLRPEPNRMYKIPRALTAEQLKPSVTVEELKKIMEKRTPSVPAYRQIDGRNVFTLNGKPVPYLAYYAFPNERGCKEFYADGMPIQYIYTKSTEGPYKFWLGSGKYDFKALDRYLEKILTYAPHAELMLSLGHNPYYGFASLYPDSVSRNMNGQRLLYGWVPGKETPDNPYTIFYLSPDYLRETSDMIRALCAHLKTSPYGKAVIGVHILGGNDGQFFRVTHADRSPDSLKVFRGYLKMIYENDLTAFRKAWGDAGLTFETAEFPKGNSGTSRYFLDGGKPADRRAIDLYNYRSWCSSEVISRLAKVYKESMDRPFWVSAYYNDSRSKNDMSKDRLLAVLNDPNIDGIASCIPYGDNRNPGNTGHSLSHAGSIDLHGKKWRMELDYRTDYANYSERGGYGYDFDEVGATRGYEEHLSLLERDLGFCLSSNHGAWYFALAGMIWGDDTFRSHLRMGMDAAWKVMKQPAGDHPPLAIFLDGNSSCYSHIYYFNWALDVIKFEYLQYLATTGLGYRSYALNDLTHPRLPKYRIYVFPLSAHMTEEQIRHVEKNLQKDGNILVFSFDVARTSGKMEDAIRRLTGIKVKADLGTSILYRNLPGGVKTPLGRSMDYFANELVAPLIYVDDPEAEAVSRFKQNPKLVSAAVKRHGNWTAVYSACPQGVTAEFLSLLAGEQKIPATAGYGDVVHRGNNMIVMHALIDGHKTVRWEKRGDLLDLATGKVVVKDGTEYSFELLAGESRWFLIRDVR